MAVMLGGRQKCCTFTSFIFMKETHFHMTFWSVGWLADISVQSINLV